MLLNTGDVVLDGEKRKYFLDEVVGQGGFGYVFKAHRENDGLLFAVKTTLPSFIDTEFKDSFKNEINTATKISGENIIKYEYTHDGDKYKEMPPYIIMEYADEGTLRDFMNVHQEFYSEKELVGIYCQLAKGMQEINKVFVHRDIKPENILICGGKLKISDFGLSKIAAENTRTMTFKGGGTPLYMAPEAWDYSKNTIQMDIYSMGIIFYELATNKYPYIPFPKSQEQAKEHHLYTPIQKISSIKPNLSQSLISVINRMLEKDIRKRFSNWQEITEALKQTSNADYFLDEIVKSAVAAKNESTQIRQQQESERKRREKEKISFCKLVQSQFHNDIILLLEEYVNKVNTSYAGDDKIEIQCNENTFGVKEKLNCKIIASDHSFVNITFEIVLKENYTRRVPINTFPFDNPGKMNTEHYIPQYKGKNILGWGEINNASSLGYNILLVENENIYGNWIIMDNKNNFSYGTDKERKEPFAFSLLDLPKEIDLVQMTHIYRTEFKDFKENEFAKMINTLLFN